MSVQISNFERVNDYYSVDVLLSGAASGSSYFVQAMFTKPDKSNYLGYTWGQKGDWIKYVSSPDKDFLAENFPIIENERVLKILIKPDIEDSGFEGPGEYQLRVKRYTAGGSGTYSDNSLTITLSDITPTVTEQTAPVETPAETPTETPVPTQTSTPTSVVTATPTPTLTSTSTPTPTPSPSKPKSPPAAPSVPGASQTPSYPSPSLIISSEDILGDATSTAEVSQEISPQSTEISTDTSSSSALNRVFIIAGLLIAIPSSILYILSNRFKISQ